MPRYSPLFPRQPNPRNAPSWPVELGNNAPRGLSFCLPFAQPGFRDLVSGRLPTITATPLLVGSQRGPSFNANTTGSLSYAMVAPTIFSMEVLLQAGPSLAGGEGAFGWNQSVDAASGTYDRTLVGNAGNNYNFYIYDGGGKTVSSTGTLYNNNVITHVVGTSDGSNIRIYVNGGLSGTLAAGTAYTGYSGTPYLVVGKTNGLTNWTGKVMLANVATVAWTADEIAGRAAEPFAMLRQKIPRTYFMAAATGGGSTNRLLLIGVG